MFMVFQSKTELLIDGHKKRIINIFEYYQKLTTNKQDIEKLFIKILKVCEMDTQFDLIVDMTSSQ